MNIGITKGWVLSLFIGFWGARTGVLPREFLRLVMVLDSVGGGSYEKIIFKIKFA